VLVSVSCWPCLCGICLSAPAVAGRIAEDIGFLWDDAWQESVAAMNTQVLPAIFTDEDRLGDATRAMKEYIDSTGPFATLRGLPIDAPFPDVIAWWATRQPYKCLLDVAKTVFSMQPSQGSVERSWAALSRQAPLFDARVATR